jgi:hypothetical protein
MQNAFARTWVRLAAAACLLASAAALGGCKGDSQLSKQDVQQMKSGPPAQMPTEAQAAFQKAMQSPPPAPPGPPGG